MAGIPAEKVVHVINEKYSLSLSPADISKQKAEAFLEIVKTTSIKAIDPVVQIVKDYYGKLPMALGTGSRKAIAKMTIDSIGLTPYFEILVAAEDVVHHKPYPDTFLRCAELLKIEPEYCMVFEDGEPGLDAAKRAGMVPVDIRKII